MNTFKKNLYQFLAITAIICLPSCSKITNLFDRTHDDTKDYIEKELEDEEPEEYEEPKASDFQIQWEITRINNNSSTIKIYKVVAYISGSSNPRTKISDINYGQLSCGNNYSSKDPALIDNNYGRSTCWTVNSPTLNNRHDSPTALLNIALKNGDSGVWKRKITY